MDRVEADVRQPRPPRRHLPRGAAAVNEVDSAVTSVLAVFPNADPTALRAMGVKRQEEGVEDLVGVVSASLLEGYTRVSAAAAKQACSTPPAAGLVALSSSIEVPHYWSGTKALNFKTYPGSEHRPP